MENGRQRFAKIFSLLGAIRAWSLNLCAAEFPHYNSDPVNGFHKSRGLNSSDKHVGGYMTLKPATKYYMDNEEVIQEYFASNLQKKVGK